MHGISRYRKSAKENDPLRMRTFNKNKQKNETSRQTALMKLLREITTPNTKNKIKKITQCLREDVYSLYETKEIGSNPTSLKNDLFHHNLKILPLMKKAQAYKKNRSAVIKEWVLNGKIYRITLHAILCTLAQKVKLVV